MNGAQLVVSFLKEKGVNPVFGYPGGPILVLYEALYEADFPHVLTRHEQGAAHAAEGFAKVTGKPGVVIATSGPGATNLVTGIADAMLDSVPLLAITGAVARSFTGKDAFQEADITGITQPITKHNYLVMEPEHLRPILEEAWALTTEGRPGPVLVNIPKDIMAMEIEDHADSLFSGLRHRPPKKGIKDSVGAILDALKKSKKPLLLLGGGAVISNGANERVLAFLKKTGMPVATTMMGKGAVVDEHPQYLGMVGMHGTPQANSALGNCDLLLAVGCRFSDRIIGDPQKYAKDINRVIIHADIDPAEIGKNFIPHIEIEEDAARFFEGLLAHMPGEIFSQIPSDWQEALSGKSLKYKEIVGKLQELDDRLLPEAVVSYIANEYKGQNPILVTDVGQNQMFATKYFPVESPRSFLTSGGLGTMGFGLPAAMGAAFAAPDRPVILFVGDGGFQMTLQELSVIEEYNLQVKIIVMDNRQLGMVRQWQELFFEKHYSHSLLFNNPDFCKIADAYRVESKEVSTAKDFKEAVSSAKEKDGPFLLHVHLDEKELVYPMIPPGQNPENIIMPGMD